MGKWKLVAAAFCVALWAAPASAQRADDMKSGQGGGQHPCASDAQSICSEFIPDRAKVASCLFKNKTRISSACSAAIGGGKSGKGSGKKKSKGKKSKKHKRH
jgi:hypothetical protein